MKPNWVGGGAGAVSGAGTGFSVGGPVGAAVGGTIGGISGLFSGGAHNDKLKKIPTGNPQQEALHNSILARAMGMQDKGGGYDLANQYYNNLLGGNQQQAFEQFSAPYLQQFQEQMLPQIAERFAGGGDLSSSAFAQSLGGATAGLQGQLAQLFSNLQGQAAQQQYGQYNQLAQTGLNYSPFAYNRQEGTQGFGGSFAQGLSKNSEGITAGIMSLFKQKSPGIGSEQSIGSSASREAIAQFLRGGKS